LTSQVRQLVGEKGRVEKDKMKEFYVQFMSNASTGEFPDNQANSFKNRLPYPLSFDDKEWKVGWLAFLTRSLCTTASSTHSSNAQL